MHEIGVKRDEVEYSSTVSVSLKVSNRHPQDSIEPAGQALSDALKNEYEYLSKSFAPPNEVPAKERAAWECGIDQAIQEADSQLLAKLGHFTQDSNCKTISIAIPLTFQVDEHWSSLDDQATGTMHFLLNPYWELTDIKVNDSVVVLSDKSWLRSDQKDATLLSISYNNDECDGFDTVKWRKSQADLKKTQSTAKEA